LDIGVVTPFGTVVQRIRAQDLCLYKIGCDQEEKQA